MMALLVALGAGLFGCFPQDQPGVLRVRVFHFPSASRGAPVQSAMTCIELWAGAPRWTLGKWKTLTRSTPGWSWRETPRTTLHKCHEKAIMGSRPVPRTCADCHAPRIRDGQTTNCLGCHTQKRTFRGITVDHAQYGLRLVGKHRTVSCRGCHLRAANPCRPPEASSDCGTATRRPPGRSDHQGLRQVPQPGGPCGREPSITREWVLRSSGTTQAPVSKLHKPRVELIYREALARAATRIALPIKVNSPTSLVRAATSRRTTQRSSTTTRTRVSL